MKNFDCEKFLKWQNYTIIGIFKSLKGTAIYLITNKYNPEWIFRTEHELYEDYKEIMSSDESGFMYTSFNSFKENTPEVEIEEALPF